MKTKRKSGVSLPIPAPPVTNYAGILEQIAQSMQDLVAEVRKIAQVVSPAELEKLSNTILTNPEDTTEEKEK